MVRFRYGCAARLARFLPPFSKFQTLTGDRSESATVVIMNRYSAQPKSRARENDFFSLRPGGRRLSPSPHTPPPHWPGRGRPRPSDSENHESIPAGTRIHSTPDEFGGSSGPLPRPALNAAQPEAGGRAAGPLEFQSQLPSVFWILPGDGQSVRNDGRLK